MNATRLQLFNGKPASEPRLAAYPGHRPYPHENNTQNTKALFPILYTLSRGASQIVAQALLRALLRAAFTHVNASERPLSNNIDPGAINGQLSALAAPLGSAVRRASDL